MNRIAQAITLPSADALLRSQVSVAAIPCDLSSLPPILHQQMFEDFADAAEERDIDYLNRVAAGWLQTSAIYGLPETRGALEYSSDFGIIHSRLAELMADDEEDDEQVKPSGYAYNKALSLLVDTQGSWEGIFPRPSITTDFNGGIRLLWRRPDRQLRVVIPSCSDGHHYLYHEHGNEYGAEDASSPASLAAWFNWLTEDVSLPEQQVQS